MESTDEVQVRVVLTALEDESDEGKARFARDLSHTFQVPEQKVWEMLAARPFVIRKSCPPGVADRIEHTIHRLGGICNIEPLAPPARPETIATATPPEARPPASARPAAPPPPHPPAPAWGADDVGDLGASIPIAGPRPGEATSLSEPIESAAPVARHGIPLASSEGPLAPRPGRGPAQSGPGMLACQECGFVQREGARDCQRCHFPLPAARKAPREGPPAPRPGPRAVPRRFLVGGYRELQQAPATVFTAAGLLIANAGVSLWSMAVVFDASARTALVSSLVDLTLAVGLLRGNAKARVWVLVRAALGLVVWGGWSLYTGDLFSTVLQVVYSASLILLLTGRGSLLKAILVGVPNTAVLGLALVGLLLLSTASSLAGVDMARVSKGLALMEKQEYDQAMAVFRGVIADAPMDGSGEVLAALYYNVGICYMKKGDPVAAIPELQASVALNDQDPDAHFLLGIAFLQAGQLETALEHLERTRALAPDYPDLEETLRRVRQSLSKTSY